MLNILVIGGGAAGFFASILAASKPSNQVTLIEKSQQLLTKVRISGGGRCNVTHACYDPKLLTQNYPRGHLELLGPFTKFQPKDMIAWLEVGVVLTTEADGRMFPVSDSSETIVNCFLNEARKYGVKIKTKALVQSIVPKEEGFSVHLESETIDCHKIILATGSSSHGHRLAKELGHTIIPPVPSLFTFNIPSSPFLDLSGVSLPKVKVKIKETSLFETGPLLFTHWGLSGPCVLKLSAWKALVLHERNYNSIIQIDWIADISSEETEKTLLQMKQEYALRSIGNSVPFQFPKKFWTKMLLLSKIDPETKWQSTSNKKIQELNQRLHSTELVVDGKTTYKEEFVTAGGVDLKDVNFKTMESKKIKGLYFAGEVLNVDGVTGGFNFQNAWTTAYLAVKAIA